jgi:DNA polymerase-4
MFYVQVARLEDPDGVGQEDLLIVGGSPTGRGVVTSASYGVREYGVRSGMPTAQALRLCPEARVVPVSRRACASRSRQVKEVLDELSPTVQAASIDEFYLDLSGTERLFHQEPLTNTATRIRREVVDRTGISVSVGGGTRKLIAKLAAGRAKPGGVHVVPPGQEAAFMREFRLREIPGVGPALAQALEKKGLVEVEDILSVDREWLEKWLGPSRAGWLWKRARGMDSSRVNPAEPRKSISSERTFGSDLTDERRMEQEILRLTGFVGSALRGKGLQGRTITVKIRDADFRTRQASHTLPDPVETDSTIYSVARSLFRELRRKRKVGVRLLGVGVSSLVEAEGPPQFELFEAENPAEPERDRVVSRALDDLRSRFGDDAILPGRMLERPAQGLGNGPKTERDPDSETGPDQGNA